MDWVVRVFLKLILERWGDGDGRWRRGGGETDRHRFVVPLVYVFIGCFLYVPWPGIEPVTLAYGDDALTNWATWAGLSCLFFKGGWEKGFRKQIHWIAIKSWHTEAFCGWLSRKRLECLCRNVSFPLTSRARHTHTVCEVIMQSIMKSL